MYFVELPISEIFRPFGDPCIFLNTKTANPVHLLVADLPFSPDRTASPFLLPIGVYAHPEFGHSGRVIIHHLR